MWSPNFDTNRSISLRRCVVLLRRHLVEHFGARRVVVVQPVGEIGENARVLLLVADGEGQNLALGQVIEIAHGVSRTVPI